MKTDRDHTRDRLVYSLDMAKRVSKTTLVYYQDPHLKVETKLDKSVVTAADRQVESELRAMIEKAFPDDAIIGEESESRRGTSGFEWILDPIDGTQSFVCGVPFFGTLIGVAYLGQPLLGVVDMPALGETYYGATGEGAWWKPSATADPVRMAASRAVSLKESLFCTTSHSGFARIGRLDLFDRLLRGTKKFRGWGHCYGHMLVASGRADLVVEPDVKIWDLAALTPIIRESGAKIFDLKGNERIDTGSAITCAAGLEEPLREFLGIKERSS